MLVMCLGHLLLLWLSWGWIWGVWGIVMWQKKAKMGWRRSMHSSPISITMIIVVWHMCDLKDGSEMVFLRSRGSLERWRVEKWRGFNKTNCFVFQRSAIPAPINAIHTISPIWKLWCGLGVVCNPENAGRGVGLLAWGIAVELVRLGNGIDGYSQW